MIVNQSDIFKGRGIEITLHDKEDFLKVKETLSRIGIASQNQNGKRLYQSCHILHKQGRYVIIHFKELFLLDGKSADFTEEDLARRNTIAKLLDEWGLVSLVSNAKLSPVVPISELRIISYKEKSEWQLITKYSVGKRR